MQPRFALVFLSAFVMLAQASCVDNEGFRCTQNDQCTGGGGQCESTGYCSFPDTSCDSGRRYGSSAGGLSDRCVGDVVAAPDADPSAPDADPNAPDADPSAPDAAPGAVDAGTPDAFEPADAGPIVVDFTPTNIPSSHLTSGTNALRLQASDRVVEINTDTGAITRTSDFADLHPLGVGFTKVNQSGAPDIGILSMTALHIADGVTVRVVGSAALAFAIGGDAVIAGVIDASGGVSSTDTAGSGGYRGGTSGTCDGAGAGGAAAGTSGADVGGGGGGHLAAGGAGGDRGGSSGGAAGAEYGGNLVPLVGGSGGGCGGGSTPRARGGGGGGAIQISARGEVSITATGAIIAAGGGGQGGRDDNGGGGGGAGGGVVIEAGRIVVAGALAANGGGGGAGADGASPGGNGERGRSANTRAAGGSAGGEGAAGGLGGAGSTGTGAAGAAVTGAAGSDNAGGGGGAAGRIRLRSDDIRRSGGMVSPMVGLVETAM